MLVKLLDYEVSNHWDIIKSSLLEVLGEENIDYSVILAKLVADELQAWYIEDDKGNKKGVLVTMAAKEPITEIPNLIVVCAKSLEVIDPLLWKNTIDSMRKWAKYFGMKNIVSYTDNERVIRILKSYGADTDTRLIKVEV